ncbi:serine hydrolase [Mangrovivirga sp. M17]|uniref:Serine hydrolase n=1 Tax=Mangrovivirga halotolerans TaxID=2993936 RepID=A0ABT3RUM6_9BACT|nr:serine hydrolase domain-containing protein [Mangrovivirga halotolerans]MCX2745475.1 serine hydrolase [Mangrovivirga halotolerans]
MKNSILITIIVYGIICSLTSYGQITTKKDLEVKIDAMIPSQVNDSTPGVVVGVVQNGELTLSKGYGMANLSYGISNDPEMVYNIGSVSKQFLGYAFAMLHVNGQLNINDPVSKYMDDWPEFDHPVTLKHLLSHTSGYREAYTMSYLAGRDIGIDRLSREECINVVRNQPGLEFAPGSRWTYNSTAWVILAEVLKEVTGQEADTWVQENILTPLNMNNTQIESYVGEVIYNAAESYSMEEDKGFVNEESNRAIFGAADIYTSITDLVKWINNYRTAEIGGSEVQKLFLDPYILTDGTDSEYALGIRSGNYRGLKRYSHTGGHEAFSTQLSYYPDYDLGIIIISNFGSKGWFPSTEIAELILGEHMTSSSEIKSKPVAVNKNILEQYSGLYLSPVTNSTIEFTISDDSLSINGQRKLIPSSENTFVMDGWNGHIQFNELETGEIQLTIINGSERTLNKVEKWAPQQGELQEFEANYWSDELETIYHIENNDNNLSIKHRWLGEIELEPVTRDIFKSDRGLSLKFARSEDGEIKGLSIYSGRTMNVYFQRQ